MVAELIQRDLTCHSVLAGVCVKKEDIYFDILGVFILTSLPSWLLSYLYIRLLKSKFWLIIIIALFSLVWVYITYLIIGGYTIFLGQTWLNEEIWYFVVYQEHYWVAYGLAFVAMLGLGFFKLKNN